MRQWMSRAAGVLLVALGTTQVIGANGEEFFVPASTDRPADLVYVGQIRDKQTGRLIEGSAYVTIHSNTSGTAYPFMTDGPGHYRSPDIGLALAALGGDSRNLKRGDLYFDVIADGYHEAKVTAIPNRFKGIVEVNVTLEPVNPIPADQLASSSSNGLLWGGLGTLVMGGMALLTFYRRRSA